MGASAPTDVRQALAWDLAEASALVDRGEFEEALFWLDSAREHAQAAGEAESLREVGRLARKLRRTAPRECEVAHRAEALSRAVGEDLVRLEREAREPEPPPAAAAAPAPAPAPRLVGRRRSLWRAAVGLGLAQVALAMWISPTAGVVVLFLVLVGAAAARRRPTVMGPLLVVVGILAAAIAAGAIELARGWSDHPDPWGFREVGILVLSGGIPLTAGILLLVSARGSGSAETRPSRDESSAAGGDSRSMWP